MAADLFETYAVTAVAVMLLGVLLFDQQSRVALYPLVLGAVSIIASIIGTFAVRSRAGNVERALYQGLIVSGVLAALAFIPITYWMMTGGSRFNGGPAYAAPHWWKYYLCALIGIGVTACLFVITDYFTSTRFAPVKHRAGLADRPRHKHHPGTRPGVPVDGAARDRARARNPRSLEARGGGTPGSTASASP